MQPGQNGVTRRPRVGRRGHPNRKDLGMRILALDLGRQKAAAFLLDRGCDEHRHTTVKTLKAWSRWQA